MGQNYIGPKAKQAQMRPHQIHVDATQYITACRSVTDLSVTETRAWGGPNGAGGLISDGHIPSWICDGYAILSWSVRLANYDARYMTDS